jgi:imidazolonepropionase-like amidohydrolase
VTDSLVVLRNCILADARGTRDDYCDVIIEGERIAEITSVGTAQSVTGAQTSIDVGGGSVIPGLVNMHSHLSFAHPRSSESAAIQDEDVPGRILRMSGNARKALGAGVTTMRLVGEFDGYEVAIRSAITKGHLEGPRIFTAGEPLTYTGGHGAAVGALEGGSAQELRHLAEESVGRGVDLLKVMISSGIAGGNVEVVRMTEEGFLAIREVARAAQLRLAVHTAAVDHPIIHTLISDGVDTLEHCYTAPPQIIDECVDRQMLLVLTPLVTQSEPYFRAIGLADDMIAEISGESERHWNVVCEAVGKGAKLALGTDFHSHLEIGGTWAVMHELELYHQAGVSPLGLLAIGSHNGATWLGLGDEVGLVEEDYVADLLVLDGNAAEDASAYRNLRTVLAKGKASPALPPQPAGVPLEVASR